ncbi:MAG: hypothetical protein K8U03_15450 [Planctomycetia bacterium]|nr:hypothetical protein [Planctomycetia bacterium]
MLRLRLRTIACFGLVLAATNALPVVAHAADKTAEEKQAEAKQLEAKQAELKQLELKQAEAKKAEEKAAADAKKAADAQKAAEAAKAIEAAKRKAEEAKLAEERKKAEEARLAREAQLKAEADARAVREAAMKAEADARAAARLVIDRAEALLRVKISRTPDDVFRAVTRWNAGAEKNANEEERFLLYIQAGEWEKLRALIAPFPPEMASRIYVKLLNDLVWGNPKPLILPTDALGVADAAPAPLDDKETVQIGRLLSYSIGKTETKTELMAALRKGTVRLGGNDPKLRSATARALAAAEFWTEAKEFGLKGSDIPSVVADVKADTPAKVADEAWDRLVVVLHDPARTADERDEALTGLHQAMVQLTPQAVDAKLGALLRDGAHPELVWEVVGLIGRTTARGQDNFDFDVRSTNLELQEAALRLIAGSKPLAAPPARTFANLFARNWLAEAQATLVTYPNWKNAPPDYRSKHQHVSIEDVLHSAPNAAWLAVLEPQLSSAAKLTVARLTLMSDNIDRLLPQLTEFAGRDKTAAVELANAYLTRWAQLHDPNFTPEALRQYRLEGQAIVLSRAEQEQSLRQLGAMLTKLDAGTRAQLDEALLVTAFDVCHSKAEPYTRDQIIEVFGPLEQIPPTLLSSLLDKMRQKLALNWRDLSVQRDAATKRDSGDVFQLVNDGYGEAEKITSAWLKTHADDWQVNCVAGSFLSDWAEFAYFQAVASGDDADRFAVYLKRSGEALDRFRVGAKSYAAAVSKLPRDEFSLVPYKAWFYGLLGISHDAGINLRKGVTREGLQEIAKAMQSLPNGAGAVHLGLFSTMVADNVKANVIAPEMKFRYLSSAVEITGRKGTVYPAQEKVQYYESLLKEIRLRSRLDGSDKIHRAGEFGVFVTLVHSADLARESGGFGKYLQNETRRVVSGRTITEQPFYRDRFEEALRNALGGFFEIKKIVFADPNAGARPAVADEAGVAAAPDKAVATTSKWQETPLAYLHLVAKDATVDRVPPLEIELDFFDRDGKVVIPVPSNPLLIEVSDAAPARRAAAKVAISETVDARELVEHKRLKMDVVASAHGLVPDLEDLIDLPGLGLKVLNVDTREGLNVSEFHSGDDGLYATSERNWTIELDPTPLLRGAGKPVSFEFPKAKSNEFAVVYRTYKDMDPVDAAAQLTLVEGEEAKAIARSNYLAWTIGGIVALLIAGLVALKMLRKKPVGVVAGPPAFVMPREATPFAVVTLLHRIQTSPEARLTEPQRSDLRREIKALEKSSFATDAGSRSAPDLKSLADRWIRTASPT